MDEQQALEPVKNGSGFLELIEKVVASPDVSVEKIKALMDMQLLLEDRQSEKEFDAALIQAQAEVQTLKWDKVNPEKNSRNVSYPKIDKMLRPIRIKHGFTQSWDTEPGQAVDMVMFCCDMVHIGGHKRRYRTPMPIDGTGPKGGGVMTKSQAVNSGTSYGMRNLAKMIWNIPMLVDKDDTDGNDPSEFITEKQVADMRAMCQEIDSEQETRLCKYFKCETLEQLPVSKHKNAVAGLAKKIREAA